MNLASLTEVFTGSSRRVHLIGVAGSGMSGIAGLLLALGHRVSGSDKVDTVEVERLEKKGLRFHIPHRADEVTGGRAGRILIGHQGGQCRLRRGQEAWFAHGAPGRCAGRHHELQKGHRDLRHARQDDHVVHGGPCASKLRPQAFALCGAEIPILGTNARWDSEGEYFVAEGDESDGTLINYHPEHAIVLNIEPEHLDFYKDLAAIDAVYAKLVGQTRGKVVYCGDDPGRRASALPRPGAISYGQLESNRYRITDIAAENFRSHFQVLKEGELLGAASLNIPGIHNAVNALAVIALAIEIGLPSKRSPPRSKTSEGARRRFEICYETPRNLVVDDYGHHPTEVAATIATARTGAGSVCW